MFVSKLLCHPEQQKSDVILSEFVRRSGRTSRRTCRCFSRTQLNTKAGAPHLDFEMWDRTNLNSQVLYQGAASSRAQMPPSNNAGCPTFGDSRSLRIG
jgi:hypothetical protein